MPNAIFKSVREVSSEDPVHNAANLIKSESVKKWKTKCSGEKSAYVILELDAPAKIIGLDIGNEHSAFIEVSVSNSGCQLANFKDILVTSSFMTPIESKNSTQINRVRLFNTEALVADTLNESWSLIKIVCSQPFNKSVQYGLSFIKVRISDTVNLNAVSSKKLNVSTLIRPENSSDSEAENSLEQFKAWKINKNKEAEEAASGSSYGINSQMQISNKASVSKTKYKLFPDDDRNRDKDSIKKVDKEVRNDKSRKIIFKKKEEITKPADETGKLNAKGTQSPKKRKSEIPRNVNNSVLSSVQYRKMNELLKGVTVVISGIQNPDRAELRKKALEMGAKYRTDWDAGCTHLICAFKNTPKYNQVKGKGKIVSKSWIESCYERKRYIPWRRHALDPKDKLTPESDEEILEESFDPHSGSGSSKTATEAKKPKRILAYSSEEDTDDEINKIQNSKNDIYNESTEEEEYLMEKVRHLPTNYGSN